MRRLAAVALIATIVLARKQILRSLSKATGTWVGTSTR